MRSARAPSLGPRRGEAGFTLLELLVALTILALVVAVGTLGLRVVTRGIERRDATSAQVAAEMQALELLRGQLGRALPLDWGPQGRFLVAFEGDADRLRFVNAQPAYQPSSGLVMWELALADGGRGGRRLIVRRVPTGPERAGFGRLAEAEGRELLRVPAGWRFDYFGPIGRQPQDLGWVASWRDAPALPLAVRLAGDAGEAGFVVRLRVDTPAHCADPSGAAAAASASGGNTGAPTPIGAQPGGGATATPGGTQVVCGK